MILLGSVLFRPTCLVGSVAELAKKQSVRCVNEMVPQRRTTPKHEDRNQQRQGAPGGSGNPSAAAVDLNMSLSEVSAATKTAAHTKASHDDSSHRDKQDEVASTPTTVVVPWQQKNKIGVKHWHRPPARAGSPPPPPSGPPPTRLARRASSRQESADPRYMRALVVEYRVVGP